MGLSCECGDHFEECFDWYYEVDDDYSVLGTKRSRKCVSCGERIAIGKTVVRFNCWHPPRNDIEERIHGDQVHTAARFMCEECGDLYYSIIELGFCIKLGADDNMKNLVKEYATIYGPKTVAA